MILDALVLTVKQSPILLLGFVGGVMWARAMHRKLTQITPGDGVERGAYGEKDLQGRL